MRKPIMIDGVEFASKTAHAIYLLNSGKSMSEASTIAGVKYQTLFASTKGLEKRKVNLNKTRIVKLATTGKYGVSDLAKRTGMPKSTVGDLLKKQKINVTELKAARDESHAKKITKAVETEVQNIPTPIVA